MMKLMTKVKLDVMFANLRLSFNHNARLTVTGNISKKS